MRGLRTLVLYALLLAGGLAIAAAFAAQAARQVSSDNARVTAPTAMLTAPADGLVENWRGRIGDRVAPGTVVASVDGLPVRARQAGAWIGVYASDGDGVDAGQILGETADLDRAVVTAYVPEAEANRVHAGESATIGLDAFPGRSWAGRVTHVGRATLQAASDGPPSDATANSTQWVPVTVAFRHRPRRLFLGMSATVTIDVP
jgi:multidrug resistance efflux pump